MAYCRWSSNNWQCDLYCYSSVDGGYVTHVAANRPVGDIPAVPEVTDPKDNDQIGAFVQAYRDQLDWLAKCERAPIGGKFDGMTFVDQDIDSFYARLHLLKFEGYRFEDSVIDQVRSEIHAMKPESPQEQNA